MRLVGGVNSVHFFVAVNADQFPAETFGFSLGVYRQVHVFKGDSAEENFGSVRHYQCVTDHVTGD